MTQRNVENFIGRIATDAELREAFGRSPSEAIQSFKSEGHELGAVESAALVEIDQDAVERLARTIDPRLRRMSPTATSSDNRRTS